MAVLSTVRCASALVTVPITTAELLLVGIAGKSVSQSAVEYNWSVLSSILGRYRLLYFRPFANRAASDLGSFDSGASKSTMGKFSFWGFLIRTRFLRGLSCEAAVNDD